MATLRDISRRVSLSPASVSKILSGQPGFNEETRQRVQTVARELDYRPNQAARGLRGNKSYLIGLADDRRNTELLAALIDGVRSAASAQRYAPIVFVHEDGAMQDQNVGLCMDRHLDGLLVTAHIEHDASAHIGALADLIKRDFPLIELHGACLPGVPSVRFDYGAGGRMAVRHLIDLGHRRIAVFPHKQRGGSRASNLFRYRQDFVAGCQAECDAAGVELITTYPAETSQRTEFIWRSVARQVIDLIPGAPRRPTAIVCMSTAEAVSILHALENAGISVPQQMSLVVHLPFGLDSSLAHRVTEVRYSPYEVGTVAVNNLFARMEGREVPNVLIGPELIIGETTAPPPQEK